MPSLTSAARSLAATARCILSPTGISGLVTEGVWVAAHVALYPFGVIGNKLDEASHLGVGHLSPGQRSLILADVEAAGTPIVLVHGLVDNQSVFTMLRRALRRRGFGRIYTVNYSPLTSDIADAAHRLQSLVDNVCEQTGYERVHIVAHSMGGLVSRYYIQRLGGSERVHTVCTLGTPHGGTLLAEVALMPVVRQMRSRSDLMAELAEPVDDCRTRFVAVWSDLDELVFPQRNGRITHPDLRARNVLVRGVGHHSLPVDRRVIHLITQALAQLDHDGSQIAPGITPIDSRPNRPAPPRASRPGRSEAAGA